MFSAHHSSRLNARLLPWTIPAGALLAWIFVSASGLAPPYLLPHPMSVVKSGHIYVFGPADAGTYAGRFLGDARASLLRVVLGFGLAALLGIPLGILSGRLTVVRDLMSTPVNALRAVPGICWLPLALVWFGIGVKTTVFLVALAGFFPVYLNAAAGARQINPLLYQSGAMMGVGRLRGVFAILIPGAMPQIITGLRLGLGIAWAYLVLGELTGVPDGLGAVIMDARMLGRIDIIAVGIIIIAVFGRLSDLGLKAGLRLCFKSARRTP
ncbi:MAG: ABC transporter permease [Desulfobacterales bacterium]